MQNHTPRYSHTSYLSTVIQRRDVDRRLASAIVAIERWEKRFGRTIDAIAFRGVSGALVAPLLAHATGKEVIAVRKDNEESHSVHEVEGDLAADTYIIVDDFVSEGTTVREMQSKVHDWVANKGRYGEVGKMEYLGCLEWAWLASIRNIERMSPARYFNKAGMLDTPYETAYASDCRKMHGQGFRDYE